ncbi:MAG: GIY-YIG nuclease family protein [Xanthobacteraceae bacterium]
MPLLFNTLLDQAHISLGEVRLLRHQDHRSDRGRSPYELWRDDRPAFELYQETQSFKNRNRLKAPYWASFVVTPVGETLLAGFYAGRYLGINKEGRPWPNNAQRTNLVGTVDIYELTLDDRLNDLAGRLVVEWGGAERSWIQRADNQNKVVLEIRTVFREPDFPGFADFIAPLSKIESLPKEWVTALRSTRGIYLLTCPKTKEQMWARQRVTTAFMAAGATTFVTDTEGMLP